MKKFFDSVRKTILGPVLSPEEVHGCQAVLDASEALPVSYRAYALATAFHETGGKMTANTESLNYSVQGLLDCFGRHRISSADARRFGRTSTRRADQKAIGNRIYGGDWGTLNLGNIKENDGWFYRGRGMDHCTGRANYTKVDSALGLGGRLVTNPDLLLDNKLAARALVSGMLSGRYRGHTFESCLPTNRPATLAEFEKARRIINPDKNGLLIARYALQFQKALTA